MTTGTDLAHREEGGRAVASASSRSDNFLAMLLEAARDPTIDAAKVKTMADLAIQLQDRERETQFAQDFAAALMEMPYISKSNDIVIPPKDGKSGRVQGAFASFENLDKVVRPILARHNMVISFKLGSDQGTTATPILTHTNGYRDIGDALKVPPDTSGAKNAAQAIGSSASYAKRYAMCAALNIVTVGEDTDGRSYPLEDDPMTDRQERLVREAEASHENGEYAKWYGKQKPTDRAWLVIKGVHGRLGGKALPESTDRREDPQAEERQQEPERQQEQTRDQAPVDPPASKHDVATPQGWANQYVDDMRGAPNLAAVERVKTKGAKGLGRLAADNTRLYDLCDVAEMEARDRLAPDQSGGEGLFEQGDD